MHHLLYWDPSLQAGDQWETTLALTQRSKQPCFSIAVDLKLLDSSLFHVNLFIMSIRNDSHGMALKMRTKYCTMLFML